MNIKEALQSAKNDLKKSGVSEPDSSAEFLLAHALGINRTELFGQKQNEIPPKLLKKFQGHIGKRKKHQPVWQIVGSVPFWGMDFHVNKNVLVPRPETEFMVKKALEEIKKRNGNLKILDIGTGAGPIAISLAHEIKKQNLGHRVFASDISSKALSVAKKNAKKNGLGNLVSFKKSDLLRGWKKKNFDIICANLPYIPHQDMPTLALDVHHYEPRLALDGGKDGLEVYEELFRNIPDRLNPGGVVFCEIGQNQGKALRKIVNMYLPDAIFEVDRDFAGIDRVASVKLTR